MIRIWIIVAVIVSALVLGGVYFLQQKTPRMPGESSFSPTPTSPSQITPTIPTSSKNIKVTEPKPLAIVNLPFTIRGEARVFESQFNWRIRDIGGNILVEHFAMANAPDAGQFGPFEINVTSLPAARRAGNIKGTIEVFDYSAKDGTEENKVTLPVTINLANTSIIKVFYSKKGHEGDCKKVFPISLAIARTETPARRALEELLKGPTRNLTDQGYFTSINEGVTIQKLTIENTVAKVDFDQKLEEAVGGSCRVANIRTQILETLLQFPTVKSVVISIDSITSDILQP